MTINATAAGASPDMTRRRCLRGIGACIALPALPSLHAQARPGPLHAQATPRQAGTTATGAPLRTAFVFFPNGAIPGRFWPAAPGSGQAWRDTLAPLQPLRQKVQILGGLDQLSAEPGADGGGDHARGNAVFLTSVRIKKSATDLRAGISIDQVLARRYGHLTRFPSLELSCDAHRRASDCDAGYSCAYQYNVSWRDPSTPLPPESNPRLAFERLFGSGAPGERAANARRRTEERRSLLDFVRADAHALQRRLDVADRRKLDQYLTGLRDLESRIDRSERFGPPPDPDQATPEGVPESQTAYVDLMFDILQLAFQTDSTRVATLVLAHDGDNRSFPEIGVHEGHHDLSHHQNDPARMDKVAAIDHWYVQRLARFLSRLADCEDVDGQSLLHNAQILYGSGNADGNRHSHDNLPIVLAGGAGGAARGGRYVQHGGKPLANLFLTLADRAGVTDLAGFGDSTGRLSEV